MDKSGSSLVNDGILDAVVIVYSKKIDDPRRERAGNINLNTPLRGCNVMYSNVYNGAVTYNPL